MTTCWTRIDRAIEPFDTAGLLDRRRRDWYPVWPRISWLRRRSCMPSEDEIDRLLERCGFGHPSLRAGS